MLDLPDEIHQSLCHTTGFLMTQVAFRPPSTIGLKQVHFSGPFTSLQEFSNDRTLWTPGISDLSEPMIITGLSEVMMENSEPPELFGHLPGPADSID